MSRGDLQEMEQSKTAVNANAKPAEPMPKLTTGGIPTNVEDLGGPTPENYSPTDDSAKLKTPGSTLKQVKDVVNKGAKPAMPMQKGVKEEEEISQENTIEEEEVSTEEVVAEQEVTTEEEVDVEEDVNALLGGEELSEEFREKAKTVFEAALQSKVNQLAEDMQAKFDEKLVEEIESTKSELAERVDAYLEYVSEEWFVENELAIEHGLKTELTESFLGLSLIHI